MRLRWAALAGALVAAALAWWLGLEAPPGARPEHAVEGTSAPTPAVAGPVLYRWRDGSGTVQITDVPPTGREYTVVDVAALERRNTIDSNPAIESAR